MADNPIATEQYNPQVVTTLSFCRLEFVCDESEKASKGTEEHGDHSTPLNKYLDRLTVKVLENVFVLMIPVSATGMKASDLKAYVTKANGTLYPVAGGDKAQLFRIGQQYLYFWTSSQKNFEKVRRHVEKSKHLARTLEFYDFRLLEASPHKELLDLEKIPPVIPLLKEHARDYYHGKCSPWFVNRLLWVQLCRQKETPRVARMQNRYQFFMIQAVSGQASQAVGTRGDLVFVESPRIDQLYRMELVHECAITLYLRSLRNWPEFARVIELIRGAEQAEVIPAIETGEIDSVWRAKSAWVRRMARDVSKMSDHSRDDFIEMLRPQLAVPVSLQVPETQVFNDQRLTRAGQYFDYYRFAFEQKSKPWVQAQGYCRKGIESHLKDVRKWMRTILGRRANRLDLLHRELADHGYDNKTRLDLNNRWLDMCGKGDHPFWPELKTIVEGEESEYAKGDNEREEKEENEKEHWEHLGWIGELSGKAGALFVEFLHIEKILELLKIPVPA